MRGPAPEVLAEFAQREVVKGEVAIVIDGPSEAEREAEAAAATADAAVRARELAAAGRRPKEITRQLQEEFHIPRNEAYDLALHAE